MKDKKVFILGMARSGYEAAKLLSKNNTVFITDMKEQDEKQVKELEELGVKLVICDDPVDYLDDSYDLLVKNPGIKYNHKTVLKARELGIDVINEVELAYYYINKDINIIGVTGSNGKTTTVTLIYKFLEKDGKKVCLGGNIGYPLCSLVEDLKNYDYLALEISDHQLCDMYKFKTNVSVLTNIVPAHLDFHDSFERYKEMKKRIFNNMTSKDIGIINYDNNEAMSLTRDIGCTKYYFSRKDKTKAYMHDNAIYYEGEKIIDCRYIKLRGVHNYENIMAAICAVKVYGVSSDSIRDVLLEFGGVEHRIEYVDTIDGVEYYNDSKATNCEATKTALNSFDNPVLLIMGGLDRGNPFDELDEAIKNVSYVACYGETKAKIKEYCNERGISCGVFDTLKEATISCYEKSTLGDVVLLSPACASWDQYKNFEDRGNEYKEIVNSLRGNE